MKLLVLTTQKEIRSFIANNHNTFLPKLLTIGEFLKRSIVTDKIFIPESLRKIYFYEAAQSVNLDSLGIPKEFEAFLREGELIYSFLKETFLEQVDFKTIDLSDTYAEFSEHLLLIDAIFQNYKNILDKNGFVDTITLEEYTINQDYFNQFEEIEIKLQGYLTKFDRSILSQITTPLTIDFEVTPFNKALAQKMFGLKEIGRYRLNGKGEVLEFEKAKLKEIEVELCSFKRRIEQANFVFAKIEEFVRDGIAPEKIAVVLPSEDFREYLEIFDRHNNLYFSMGESFIYSSLYIWLEKCVKEPSLLENITTFKALKEEILKKASDREKRVIEEELFLFEQIFTLTPFSLPKALKLLLERFSELSFDDTQGGKVTVMGVLESRGVVFDGVIVADFNEGVVPKVSGEDLFLNSAIKKRANLPTLKDKESLQKHYYYRLFKDAKRVAISYVKDKQQDISRFFYELPINSNQEKTKRYEEVLYKLQSKPQFYTYNEEFSLPKELSPTALDMLLHCPLRYYLQNIKQIKPPFEEVLGAKIHRAIAKAISDGVSSSDEYGKKIMQNLLRGATKQEIFSIKTAWEAKLLAFSQKDFINLRGKVRSEESKKRLFGGVMLQARADRVIYKDGAVFIYDYKTSRKRDYAKESNLQAAFYSYIWQTDKVYFWDLYNTNLHLYTIDPQKSKKVIKKALESVKTSTLKSSDSAYCRFCPYHFGCKGVV